MSSYTWRQVVKLVVIVKVILVVWLVIMVVGDRSKDILSTTVRRLGRAKCGNDVEREKVMWLDSEKDAELLCRRRQGNMENGE